MIWMSSMRDRVPFSPQTSCESSTLIHDGYEHDDLRVYNE